MVANQHSVSPTLLGELVSALPSSCGPPPNTSKPLWKRAPWVTEAVETEIRLGTAPKLPTTENEARNTFFWPGRETAIGKASQMPIPSKINFYCFWTFKAVPSQCWTSHSATKHPRLWESCSGCDPRLQCTVFVSSPVHQEGWGQPSSARGMGLSKLQLCQREAQAPSLPNGQGSLDTKHHYFQML